MKRNAVVSLEYFWASLGSFGQKPFAPQKFACAYTYDLCYILMYLS